MSQPSSTALRGPLAILAAALYGVACSHTRARDTHDPPTHPADPPAGNPLRPTPRTAGPAPAFAPAEVVHRCFAEPATVAPDAFGIPGDVAFAVWVDERARNGPKALGHLASYARSGPPGLSLTAAFALGNLDTEHAFLQNLLNDIGLEPAASIRLASPGGIAAWILVHGCTSHDLRRTFEAGWSLGFESVSGIPVGRPPPGAPIPYGVVLLPGHRIALVPPRMVTAFLAWIEGPTRAGSSHGRVPPQDVLDDLAPHPVRVVLHPHGLSAGPGLRRLAGTADGMVPPSDLERR